MTDHFAEINNMVPDPVTADIFRNLCDGLTVSQVAKLLHVGPENVRKWRKYGAPWAAAELLSRQRHLDQFNGDVAEFKE